MKTTLYSLIFSLLLFGCKKEDSDVPAQVDQQSVFIGNEGNFPDGISTITLYDPIKKEVQQDVYQKSNDAPIGTTVNDILVDGDRTFFVMNGSGSVVVVHTSDMTVYRVFKNLNNVRNIVKAAENKYYVSSWGLDAVYVLDMTSETISNTINVGTGPSAMLHYKDWILVANGGGYTSDSSISVIDIQKEAVVSTFRVGENPNSLAVDAEDRLWVLASGIPNYTDPSAGTRGAFHVFSLNALAAHLEGGTAIAPERVISFDNKERKPKDMTMSADGRELFFLHDGVEADIYRMSIEDREISSQAFISGSFYTLAYNTAANELYVSNPLSYSENGKIMRFSADDGSLIDEFTAGVIPGSFAFR